MQLFAKQRNILPHLSCLYNTGVFHQGRFIVKQQIYALSRQEFILSQKQFLLRSDDYTPIAKQQLQNEAVLKQKLQQAIEELKSCVACPRNCKVNRLEDKVGLCNTGRKAIVSSAFPHFGEEDILRGWNGSGTIFFGMCNLRCVFCQNWDISQKRNGQEMDASQISNVMLQLQKNGCHNINFVTPEHVVPQVVEAIVLAVKQGLKLPIVYNTSSYDALSSLKLMDGLVDIYMPDFKFWTAESGRRYAKARDYAGVARETILEMHRQVGDLLLNEQGLAVRGVLVRHLVMPGLVEEGKQILTWLREKLGPDTYVNIMGQYRPSNVVGSGERRAAQGVVKYEEIDRRIEDKEVDELKMFARKIGLWRVDERVYQF
eukprot:TRINITY_DN6706_c0_g2_i1.p1 TRINITY_DN6706_c0_g2~~TRINITY_DN6706_c0_g2_i1.p1  ORF type:complete len:404 (-),score=23.23 TRINITY_DN6706_c0_g2_i1:102-1220(-)